MRRVSEYDVSIVQNGVLSYREYMIESISHVGESPDYGRRGSFMHAYVA